MSEESAKLRMNLVAIQNVDPYAKEILASSPHVAFYKFANDRNEWEKSEIEGSFFVYSRVAEPFNSIFINNRLNTNSLVEPITKNIELQQQKPFLLYRNQRSAISGFWFYCEDDCIRVHALLERLIKKCNNVRPADNGNNKSNHPVAAQHQQQHQQVFVKGQNGAGQQRDVDIFSMLSKAQDDFNKSGNSDGSQLNQNFAGMELNHPPPPQQQPRHHHQQQPIMKNLPSAMPDITSPNVVNFFAAAQIPVVNGAPVIKGEGQMIPSQTKPFISNHPLAQTVPTLDEIEKQHRVSSSPQQQKIEPKMIKADFNNLLNSVAHQPQQQSVDPIMMQRQQSQGPGKPSPALITPAMLQASKPPVEQKIIAPVPVQQTIRPEPLTQNQLMQALNYMLETDPDFIRKVHEAYVKSFNKIVSL